MVVSLIVSTTAGCSAPQRVTDDIEMLKVEAQAQFELNQRLLDKSISTNEADLRKKMKLIMISKMAHERTMRALQLLSEYVDSTEFLSNAEASETKRLIIETVNEVLRQRDEQ